MRNLFCLVILLLYFNPLSASAAVIINEIAWMGDSESANNEWIELHNTGDVSINVDDWKLTDGMNLEINLSGTIAGNKYVVLERTDEDSAPGQSFLIYTGALSNTGATLKLYRADGGLEDQVAGGSDWSNIGGDNTTKETAQYTSKGWVTAFPTPGGENNLPADNEEKEAEEESEKKSEEDSADDSSGSPAKSLVLPGINLRLDLLVPEYVYVNKPVTFEVSASGIGDTLINSLTYEWNLGDLTTETGEKVTHVYANPGEYMLTVYANYARQKALLKQRVTVLPVNFSLDKNDEGDLIVSNKSPYEVDVSGYKLFGTKELIFPKHSYILPHGSVVVDIDKVGLAEAVLARLYDNSGQMVAAEIKEKSPETSVHNTVESLSGGYIQTKEIKDTKVVSDRPSDFSFAEENIVNDDNGVATTAAIQKLGIKGEANMANAISSNDLFSKWPYLTLFILLFLALLSVLIANKRNLE